MTGRFRLSNISRSFTDSFKLFPIRVALCPYSTLNSPVCSGPSATLTCCLPCASYVTIHVAVGSHVYAIVPHPLFFSWGGGGILPLCGLLCGDWRYDVLHLVFALLFQYFRPLTGWCRRGKGKYRKRAYNMFRKRRKKSKMYRALQRATRKWKKNNRITTQNQELHYQRPYGKSKTTCNHAGKHTHTSHIGRNTSESGSPDLNQNSQEILKQVDLSIPTLFWEENSSEDV